MSKLIWSLIFIIVACLVVLAHTGEHAEQKCLELGNSASECAALRL